MSEWSKKTVGDICKVKGGKRLPAGKEFADGNTPFPYLRVKDMVDGTIDQSSLVYVKPEIEPFIHNYKISKDNLYVTIAGTLGLFGTIPDFLDNAQLTENAAKLCDIDFNKFDKYFLKYYLNSENVQSQINREIGVGGGVPKLAIFRIEKLVLKYPDRATQRRIARILSTADAVIEKTQAAIAKYKAIKQGMLHDLFTRGIDTQTGKLRPKYQDAPELYKDSKLGWIPKEWEVFRLEEITDYVDYRGKTPPKSEFGVYLVTARNIKDGYIDYEVSKEYIREDAFDSAMSRGKAKLGDVLITTEAPLGNVAQIDKEDIALAQRVIKYRGFENKLNNDFLGRFLMSDIFQRQLYANATGSTVLGIKGSRLHRLYICVPKLKEQESIVKRLISTENKIQTEQNYLHKLQHIKAGLMADLLSGKKKVIINEPQLYEQQG